MGRDWKKRKKRARNKGYVKRAKARVKTLKKSK